MPSIINATTTNGVAVSGDNSGALALQTNNGTTAVTITTSQNVGIGTTSPNQTLQVNGNIMSGNGSAANPGYNFVASSATGMFTPDGFVVAFSANGTERMRITSAGVVQAGTTGTGEVFAQNTVKVWGAIAAGSGTLYNSFGVSSISKNSTGYFTVNFSRTLASSRFGMAGAGYAAASIIAGGNESTTSTGVRCYNDAGTLVDADIQFLIAGGS